MTWTPPQRIRPNVIGIALRPNGDVLCCRVMRHDGSLKGHRPPGGGIEFGETAVEALKREILEELGEPVHIGRRLAVIENIFEHEGFLGHELMFVYEMAFSNPSVLGQNRLKYAEAGRDDDWMEWVNPCSADVQMFPSGIEKWINKEIVE